MDKFDRDVSFSFLCVGLLLVLFFIFLLGVNSGSIKSLPQQQFERETSEVIFDTYCVVSRDYFDGVYYFVVYDSVSYVMYTCSYSSRGWSDFEVLYNEDGSFRTFNSN